MVGRLLFTSPLVVSTDYDLIYTAEVLSHETAAQHLSDPLLPFPSHSLLPPSVCNVELLQPVCTRARITRRYPPGSPPERCHGGHQTEQV